MSAACFPNDTVVFTLQLTGQQLLSRVTQVCICVFQISVNSKELHGRPPPNFIWITVLQNQVQRRVTYMQFVCSNSNLSVFPWQWINPTLFTWDKYKSGISLATPTSAWRTMRLIGIWGNFNTVNTLVCAVSEKCQKQVWLVQKQMWRYEADLYQIWTPWKAINNDPI